jgi:predicted regulator of Ras-like GTPase activity (Roadblock/LC7/MglB family)
VQAAAEKGEVQDSLNALMSQPGAIGYVLVNFDGIPVKHFPEDLPAVQYSALVSDLVMKTKSTLKQLNQADSEFGYLRMRTK